MKFVERLNGFTVPDLQKAFRGMERKCPPRKAEMVAELNRIWLDEPQAILERMGKTERLMLADSAHGGREDVSPERLKARHGLDFRFGYGLENRADRSTQYIQLFVQYDYGEYLLLEDVADSLREHLPEPEALEVKVADPVLEDLELFETEATVFPELRRMLQLVAAGKLKVSEKTGLPSAAAMKVAATALAGPDDPRGPDRPFIWPVLLQQCGWARFRAGKFGLSPEGKALLDGFSVGGFRRGVRGLMHDGGFDEILRVPEIKGFRGKMAKRCWRPAAGRRMDVFDALASFPVGEWVSLDDAYNFLLASGGDCRVVTAAEVLYICDREYGALWGEEWNIGKVYFRQLACESLATLGLVDLLHREDSCYWPDLADCWGMDGLRELTFYDGIEHLRLTPLGRHCLGDGEAAYEPPVAERQPLFNVLPNHEIVVVDPAAFSPADAAQLERFANRVSDAVWRMGRQSVFAALENGDGEAEILPVLEAGSANEIPGTVIRLIRETAARADVVRRREPAEAVTFADEQTAALVESERTIAPTLLGRNGATLFVRAKNLKKFQGGLRRMGILLP